MSDDTSMNVDLTNGEAVLDTLSYEECMVRLRSRTIGRLGLTVGYYPQIIPVNYRMDDFVVVFRTHIGTTLLAAKHANVCFQIDEFNHDDHTGWSVLVRGMAEDVTDRTRDPITERGRRLDVTPWAPGDKPRIVRIVPAWVSGRILSPHSMHV